MIGLPTQKEYDVAKQRGRELYATINLLNKNFQIVDEWSNIVIGDPSFTNDSNSDLRRSCSLSLIPINRKFDVAYDSEIWLDKYMQIYLGIKDIHTDEIIYTNMGIYIPENPSISYSANNCNINLQGIDLMARLTGLRNGNLEGLSHIIYANTNVRQAIIATLELADIKNYIVSECEFDVPNDIKINIGGTIYDILKQLVAIAPNYQIYFDVDGVFHYEKIPSGKNEQIMVDDDLWNSVLISYQKSYDFDSVKNSITVYGKTHDIKNFANATISENTYTMEMSSVTEYRNNLKIGFTAPNKINNPYIDINGYGAKPLKNQDGTFAELEDGENIYYVAKYIEEEDYFYYMGEITPVGYAKDNNEESPFYIDGDLGEIRIVLSGGEYDNIFTSRQAKLRADWELYTRCKLKDNITITCVPVYWLDTNWLVEITLPNKQGAEVKNKYLIKSINTSFGTSATQTINLMRFYEYYNE